MKGVLAGVAFLFSVGAVSTKLLGVRYTDFCFCSPPLAQPAFTAPAEAHKGAVIIGGALPARVIAQRAPLQVEVINAPSLGAAVIVARDAVQSRAVAHLGVLWGTDDHFRRGGGSSGGGSFMGGSARAGGGMMGGRGVKNNTTTNHNTTKPTSSPHPSTRPSAPAAPPAVAAPSAGVILPPTSGTFAGNCGPVPGFGTGTTGTTSGTTGVTLGGIPIGGGGVNGLSVTPEPATMLLTLTGLFFVVTVLRRERSA
jgi:hypothetical protein